jgi:hypothetical protein
VDVDLGRGVSIKMHISFSWKLVRVFLFALLSFGIVQQASAIDYSDTLEQIRQPAVYDNGLGLTGAGTKVAVLEAASLNYEDPQYGGCTRPTNALDHYGWVPEGANCKIAYVICFAVTKEVLPPPHDALKMDAVLDSNGDGINDSLTSCEQDSILNSNGHPGQVVPGILAVAPGTKIVMMKAQGGVAVKRAAFRWLYTNTDDYYTDPQNLAESYLQDGNPGAWYAAWSNSSVTPYAGTSPAEHFKIVAASWSGLDITPVGPNGAWRAQFTQYCEAVNPAIPTTDTDGDGYSDVVDNCTDVPNRSVHKIPGKNTFGYFQPDGDGDGYGDACDGDLDNNGFSGPEDPDYFRAAMDVGIVDLNVWAPILGPCPWCYPEDIVNKLDEEDFNKNLPTPQTEYIAVIIPGQGEYDLVDGEYVLANPPGEGDYDLNPDYISFDLNFDGEISEEDRMMAKSSNFVRCEIDDTDCVIGDPEVINSEDLTYMVQNLLYEDIGPGFLQENEKTVGGVKIHDLRDPGKYLQDSIYFYSPITVMNGVYNPPSSNSYLPTTVYRPDGRFIEPRPKPDYWPTDPDYPEFRKKPWNYTEWHASVIDSESTPLARDFGVEFAAMRAHGILPVIAANNISSFQNAVGTPACFEDSVGVSGYKSDFERRHTYEPDDASGDGYSVSPRVTTIVTHGAKSSPTSAPSAATSYATPVVAGSIAVLRGVNSSLNGWPVNSAAGELLADTVVERLQQTDRLAYARRVCPNYAPYSSRDPANVICPIGSYESSQGGLPTNNPPNAPGYALPLLDLAEAVKDSYDPNDPMDDTDSDGVFDPYDNCLDVVNGKPDDPGSYYDYDGQRDSDGDGYGNSCDSDLNNDWVNDAADQVIMDAANTELNPSAPYNPDADLNNDGVVDVLDDGIFDTFYGQPISASGLDTDGDRIVDNLDNCITHANTDQADNDEDRFGNMCDSDFNNDGLYNFDDINIFVAIRDDFANFTPPFDIDKNGTIDSIDKELFRDQIDYNFDGVIDQADTSYFSQNLFFQLPGPSGLCLDSTVNVNCEFYEQ